MLFILSFRTLSFSLFTFSHFAWFEPHQILQSGRRGTEIPESQVLSSSVNHKYTLTAFSRNGGLGGREGRMLADLIRKVTLSTLI